MHDPMWFDAPLWFNAVGWLGAPFIIAIPWLLREEKKLQTLNLFGPDPDEPGMYVGEGEDINAE